MHAIYIQVNYSHQLKFFFWIIEKENTTKEYGIGHGQPINIMSNIDGLNYDGGLHGYLILKNNKWQINSIYLNENIWVKLIP